MRRIFVSLILLCVMTLTACGTLSSSVPTATPVVTPSSTPEVTPSVTPNVTPTPSPTPTATPEPLHSSLYIEGVDVEDVIRYFNEVCLDAEMVSSGNPNKVQKWTQTIYYALDDGAGHADRGVIDGFVRWLNTVEGFPGMEETDDRALMNLEIHFCPQAQIPEIMGDNFVNMDGGVTFYYENNEIYSGKICYSTDVEQYVRNSVLLEEIYNGLGPIQDTELRTDSIIYAGYSTPQALTSVDELLLRLLYHPDIKCGMDEEECEAVIRRLYY